MAWPKGLWNGPTRLCGHHSNEIVAVELSAAREVHAADVPGLSTKCMRRAMKPAKVTVISVGQLRTGRGPSTDLKLTLVAAKMSWP